MNLNRPDIGWEYLGSATQLQTRSRYSTVNTPTDTASKTSKARGDKVVNLIDCF